ncbi:hypothetical protein PLICRDRAFT_36878 [Plicaturopsis crispa FD-325 SS-3]|nr:hypothetical protein PLICRDRAFT_36878 [Plicaturopsis crispa FD-325 SS-3]
MSAPQFPALPSVNPTVLPLELVEVLNHTYFLHLLATDPSKVLPPGKSLLAMMSRSHIQGDRPHDTPPSLQEKVEDMVHQAFWDEALESLSSPEPSRQLPRLKHLYKDLLDALTPLLPPQHPIIILLSSPLSPTPSPLLSAINHLRDIVACLRERCAPARDEYADELLHALADPSLFSSSPSVSPAQLIVNTVKSILKLTDVMKDDLSQFVLGTMGEKQLRTTIVQQARAREREVVLSIWKPGKVQEDWKTWLSELSLPHADANAQLWIIRLLQALGSDEAVSCHPPTVTVSVSPTTNDVDAVLDAPPVQPLNALPPTFFFSHPALLYLQNYIQAVVIAAALRSLTRLPASSPSNDFMQRVWTLLKAEIDGEEGAGDTKLVNLADEVIRARRQGAADIDADEETRLRDAVARTLQPRDPVFLLLRTRLVSALAAHFAQPRVVHALPDAPQHMKTGREDRRAARSHLFLDQEPTEEDEGHDEAPLTVKGFEDTVLLGAVDDAVKAIRKCTDWVEGTWADVVALKLP